MKIIINKFMSRRRLADKNIRKIVRIGKSSVAITLPVAMVRKLKWQHKQKVVLSLRGKTISIKDWPAPRGRKKK